MIIPAIDLMSGQIVSLRQGKTKIFETPCSADSWKQMQYFPEVNVIDLDAALGRGTNKKLILKLCQKLSCNVGGGIRSKELAEQYLRAGAKHIIIGTQARVEFLKQLPPQRVLVALDVKNDKIMVEGWKKSINAKLKDKIKELEPYCAGFLITDVNVEGKNQGVNWRFIKKLRTLTTHRIIVAGGISDYKQMKQLDGLGLDQVLGYGYYSGKIDLNQAFLNLLTFQQGLIPTITQDSQGQVLMLAYSNPPAIIKTLTTGTVHYFSRSRNRLWKKGESSGHVQKLIQFNYDCDADTLLYTVTQKGVACHQQRYSCFSQKNFSWNYLRDYLRQSLVEQRTDSYTVQIANSADKLKRKIMEEAYEVTQARTKAEQIWEAADLLYFLTVYLAKYNLTFNQVLNELSLRHRKLIN